MQNKSKLVSGFIIGTFVTLYLMVSVISTIHVIDFFKLSNPTWLAISLAVAFEVGAAASLASLIALRKMNKGLVWMLFFLLTAMQAMGNTYYAYVNLQDFQAWSELFGLIEEEVIFQKRVLSIVSGAILPIVALGFIKSLVDYIKPEEEELKKEEEDIEETDQTPGLLVDGGGSLTPVSAQTVEETESINEVAPTTEELNSEQEEPQGEEPSEEVTGEELPQIETVEHNGGQVVITEQRLLPKMVEMPSASINPTRL
jgi:hypothetical protein